MSAVNSKILALAASGLLVASTAALLSTRTGDDAQASDQFTEASAARESGHGNQSQGNQGNGQGGGQGNGNGNGNGQGKGNGGGQGNGLGMIHANVNGAYRILISGYYAGEGHATVGAMSVNINVKLTSDAGTDEHLKAPHLQRNGNYFSGTGTLAGQEVTLTGRIDPPDGVVIKVARLSCHIEVGDGHSLLGAGQRRGN